MLMLVSSKEELLTKSHQIESYLVYISDIFYQNIILLVYYFCHFVEVTASISMNVEDEDVTFRKLGDEKFPFIVKV